MSKFATIGFRAFFSIVQVFWLLMEMPSAMDVDNPSELGEIITGEAKKLVASCDRDCLQRKQKLKPS